MEDRSNAESLDLIGRDCSRRCNWYSLALVSTSLIFAAKALIVIADTNLLLNGFKFCG